MSIYPYKAEQYINEADKSLDRMESSKTIYEINEAFISFLNASRFVFQSWNTDFKKLDGFAEWWKIKSQFLESDELCKFFRKLRNDVIKKGKEPFWCNQTIKGPVKLKGPLQIGPQGILKGSIERGRPKWTSIAVNGVITTVGLRDVPEGFKGVDPIGLCEKYINILRDIIDEFIITFN